MGALTLLRERRRPHFTPADVRCVASLVAPLAEGIRRALVLGDLVPETQSERGVAVLAADNSVELANPAARQLLDALAADGTEELPIVIQAVANRARRAATEGVSRGAVARARTRSGRWLRVDGSMLGDGPAARAVVVLEPAHAPALAPLIAAAYGLSERERRVTELVARGYSTGEISARLHLSAWTVQDHLKAIFTKTGTGTRGELVARLYVDHYAARLSESSE